MEETHLLTPKLFKSLEKRLGDRFCCKFGCGFSFKIGDEIVSKTIRGGRKVLYHKHCYDSTLHLC